MDTKMTLMSIMLCLTAAMIVQSEDAPKSTVSSGQAAAISSAETARIVWGTVKVVKNTLGDRIIEWSTLIENDTQEFLIQRSDNGHTFHAFRRIVAHGNSTRPIEYEAKDMGAKGGVYYRIIAISGGKVDYSKVVHL